jgi:hypothetical protein
MDAEAARPHSDEIALSFERQLSANFTAAASYVRRQQRNGLGIIDLARPAAAYTPVQRTYLNPDTGALTPITVFNLDPSLTNTRDRLITNIDVLRSNWNSAQFTLTRRLADGWRLVADVTLQKHRGFARTGAFTNPGTTTDFNDPTFRLNRDDSSVLMDTPWQVNVSGSYELPYEIDLSARYSARAGVPLVRTFEATDLNQGPQTVWVQPRGRDRTETINKLVDVQLRRRFDFEGVRFEGTMDLLNLLNADHVMGRTTATGSTWGTPTLIVAPLTLRFGITVRF